MGSIPDDSGAFFPISLEISRSEFYPNLHGLYRSHLKILLFSTLFSATTNRSGRIVMDLLLQCCRNTTRIHAAAW